jgi:hypothetical protein
MPSIVLVRVDIMKEAEDLSRHIRPDRSLRKHNDLLSARLFDKIRYGHSSLSFHRPTVTRGDLEANSIAIISMAYSHM